MEDRLLKPIIPLQPTVERHHTGGTTDSPKKKSTASRATQTLFRTLSQNNYRLQEMIDRKANILISVNAIILSILVSSSFLQSASILSGGLTLPVLLTCCTLSVLASLIAIKPVLVSFAEKAKASQQLLSFEAAKHLDFESYKKAVKKTIKKENRIYDTMIADIYNVSQNVSRKHLYLKVSGSLFGLGLLLTSILAILQFAGVL